MTIDNFLKEIRKTIDYITYIDENVNIYMYSQDEKKYFAAKNHKVSQYFRTLIKEEYEKIKSEGIRSDLKRIMPEYFSKDP